MSFCIRTSTQDWSDELFGVLKAAGGKVYSNYAVGFNNIVLEDATKHGIAVGNTPGPCGAEGRGDQGCLQGFRDHQAP